MKMIPVPMGPDLIREMMAAMKAGNYTNRSEFIRDAIVEKAVSLGLKLPGTLARPPQRVVYPPHQEEVMVVEESRDKVSAEDAALKVQEIMGAAQLAGKEGAAMLGLKPRAASPSGRKAGPSGPVPPANKPRPTPPKPAPISRG